MNLDLTKVMFINTRSVVLRNEPNVTTRRSEVNHLIMGDYARYLGEEDGEWVKIRSRRSNGWVKKNDLTNDRMLEVNFVDIGQGDGCHIVTPDDEVILLDAGEGKGFSGDGGDNMFRFLSWRYNLRKRRVKGVDGINPNDLAAHEPFDIDYIVISHPDLDHYYGFESIFKSPKLKINKIYHNGIVERPEGNATSREWFHDLGPKLPQGSGHKQYHLWDTVLTNDEMHALLDQHASSRKYYISTLQAARDNNDSVEFHFLDASQEHMAGFTESEDLTIEVLAPITETIEHQGTTRECLPTLGNEGKTKNGHSIVLRLIHGKLKMILGGDLNRKSQDYLAAKYSGIETPLSSLEKDIKKLLERLSSSSLSSTKKRELEQELQEAKDLQQLIITRTKRYFNCDIAKACHHGASDILDSFLYTYSPIATVISSGDEESHSHPRPDALGAFGRSSRGNRPLIFSTELARSSKEFSYPIKFYRIMRRIEDDMHAATDPDRKEVLRNRLESFRESNVAKYGMITVRSDGERVLIAQMLEKKRSNGQRWDLYDLTWNRQLGEFEYVS